MEQSRIDLMVRRGEVNTQIAECKECGLHNHGKGPVPFRGPTPCRIMVLGEAPGITDDRRGKPFLGETGRLLDSMCCEAGLGSTEQMFLANSICCLPVNGVPGEVLSACLPNLRSQVQLADPAWVLTLGSTALTAVQVDAQVTKVHGRPFGLQYGPFINRWIFPTFHPNAVIRDPKLKAKVMADLTTFRDCLEGTMDIKQIALVVGRRGKVKV
jgi:uracil-DNA glycosylase family 4